MNEIGFQVFLDQPYENAIQSVTQALKSVGFGVLTHIDVKATLKAKLDEDFRPYAILGACNPILAHKALSTMPEIGMLLPCNVTVEAAAGGGSVVRILDPKIMVSVGKMADNHILVEVANEAYQKLTQVVKILKKQTV
ncbi:MAG: DUF302 domain-containing protein [Anaerolineales bacterium]|jgi:uncharacterized protein (DUF302 family)|nr:DUF302 domain-containing protein [Anaerolineales bacterium]